MKASQCSGDLYWIKPRIETFWSNYSGTSTDWLDLNIFPPAEDALPMTRRLLNTWKTISLWRHVNVLAIYTESNHEYWLFDLTTVVHSTDWLTGPEYFSTCGSCSTRDQKAAQHLENWFCHQGKSVFWPFTVWVQKIPPKGPDIFFIISQMVENL